MDGWKARDRLSPERPPAAPLKAGLCLLPAHGLLRGVGNGAGGWLKRPGVGKEAPDSNPRPAGGAVPQTQHYLLGCGQTDADRAAMPPVDGVSMAVKKRPRAALQS